MRSLAGIHKAHQDLWRARADEIISQPPTPEQTGPTTHIPPVQTFSVANNYNG